MSILRHARRLALPRSTPGPRARRWALAALALAVGTARPARAMAPAAQRKGPIEIEWRGEVHHADALPDGLEPGARAAIESWAPWMEAQRYRGGLSADGRVLLLVPARSKIAKRLDLIERTSAHFDQALPLPKRRLAADKTPEPGNPAPEPAGPDGGTPADAAQTQDPAPQKPADGSWSYSWSDDGPPRETETAVVLELGDRSDQALVIRHLAKEHPYLSAFPAETVSGFSLERPLVASWLANEPENEEWSPDAELVHRTATLLFLRRFGQQPFWVQTGAAWNTEIALLDGVWCFPYRAEFIFAVEHSGWPTALGNMYAKRAKQPFRLDEVADWKRGTWDKDAALQSWGLAAWFATEHPGVLSEILEDLYEHRDKANRVDLGNGSWKRIPGWEVSVADQAAILERHLGPQVFEDVTEAFRNARRGALAKTRVR